jgi:large subunit GTPase 1
MQVIDARDPLTYRSSDLEDYAHSISRHKGSMLLLNKSDLLPEVVLLLIASRITLCAVDGNTTVSSVARTDHAGLVLHLIPWYASQAARVAWADYFDSKGISYLFWSAKLAAQVADDEAGARSS